MLKVYSGTGSILFNTASTTNAIVNIAFKDVTFYRVLGNQLIGGGTDPLILSTQIPNNLFYSSWMVTFERVIFYDVLFSLGNRLLDFATIDISFKDC